MSTDKETDPASEFLMAIGTVRRILDIVAESDPVLAGLRPEYERLEALMRNIVAGAADLDAKTSADNLRNSFRHYCFGLIGDMRAAEFRALIATAEQLAGVTKQ